MILFDSVAVTNRASTCPRRSGGRIRASSSPSSWLLLSRSGPSADTRGKRQEQTGDILPVFWVSLGLFFVPSILSTSSSVVRCRWTIRSLAASTFQGGIQLRNSLIALWFALSLYTGAFIAEIVRAGILAVSKGQTEAAYALGLRPNRTMNLVILPQALRVIIPPLISQYLNLTKNSRSPSPWATWTSIHAGRHHHQPDRARARGDAASRMLFYLATSLIISACDERLQQLREAEGALR
jgi:general L-amino acid transport system permease protein